MIPSIAFYIFFGSALGMQSFEQVLGFNYGGGNIIAPWPMNIGRHRKDDILLVKRQMTLSPGSTSFMSDFVVVKSAKELAREKLGHEEPSQEEAVALGEPQPMVEELSPPETETEMTSNVDELLPVENENEIESLVEVPDEPAMLEVPDEPAMLEVPDEPANFNDEVAENTGNELPDKEMVSTNSEESASEAESEEPALKPVGAGQAYSMATKLSRPNQIINGFVMDMTSTEETLVNPETSKDLLTGQAYSMVTTKEKSEREGGRPRYFTSSMVSKVSNTSGSNKKIASTIDAGVGGLAKAYSSATAKRKKKAPTSPTKLMGLGHAYSRATRPLAAAPQPTIAVASPSKLMGSGQAYSILIQKLKQGAGKAFSAPKPVGAGQAYSMVVSQQSVDATNSEFGIYDKASQETPKADGSSRQKSSKSGRESLKATQSAPSKSPRSPDSSLHSTLSTSVNEGVIFYDPPKLYQTYAERGMFKDLEQDVVDALDAAMLAKFREGFMFYYHHDDSIL